MQDNMETQEVLAARKEKQRRDTAVGQSILDNNNTAKTKAATQGVEGGTDVP
jgi:hypothetical protein